MKLNFLQRESVNRALRQRKWKEKTPVVKNEQKDVEIPEETIEPVVKKKKKNMVEITENNNEDNK